MTLVESVAAQRQEEQVRDVHSEPVLRGRPGHGPLQEYLCPTCGARTRNAAGRCRPCLVAGLTADLSFLTVDQLRTMASNARAELQRRAELVSAALRETA